MLAIFFTFIISTFRPDHAVSLKVVAPWDSTPVFEQILFFCSENDYYSAETLLKTVLSNHNQINDTDYIWKLVSDMVAPNKLSQLKAQIEVGFYAPRGEMYREMAKSFGGSNIGNLIIVGREIDGLESKIPFFKRESVDKLEFDFCFGDSERYVYANLHDLETARFVLDMIEKNISFILRPTSHSSGFSPNLRGFGIELRPFKYSMEYGVKDSIVLDAAKKNQELSIDPTVSRINDIPPSYFNTSGVTDFGERFTTWLLQKNTSLTSLMRDLTNNYPLFMAEILNTEPSIEGTDQVSMFNRLRSKRSPFSSVNGRIMPIKHLDVFTLLDSINQERNIRDVLQSRFKIAPAVLNNIFGANFDSEATYLLDTRSDNVFYYNDIEKDAQYSSWSTDTRVLFQPLDAMPRFRKNLLNLILYIDPSTPRGLSELYTAVVLADDEFPVRVGIVPCFNLGSQLSRKVAFAFHHLAKVAGQKEALRFLIDTFSICGIDEEKGRMNKLTESHFVASYGLASKRNDVLSLTPWGQIHELFDIHSDEYVKISAVSKYVSGLGLSINSNLLNGRVISSAGGIQALAYEIQSSLVFIQRYISRLQLSDLTNYDIFDLLAVSYFVVPSVDKRVLEEKPKSLGISKLPLSYQTKFLEFIESLEWTHVDHGLSSSYYLLFCSNDANLSVFNQFMTMNHTVPATFAINPSIPSSLKSVLNIDTTHTTLVVNGRVYSDVDIDDLSFLKLVDTWNSYFVFDYVEQMVKQIKYKRSSAIAYLQSLIIDWRADSIVRRVYSESFWKVNSVLIHNTNSSSDITWDLVVDPFTRDFQRISSIIEYIERLGVANIRLLLLPPPDLTEATTTITTYYRNALDMDSAFFTMLNDTTTYSSMPDMPVSWVTESMRASVDLDNILLSELSPSTHEGVYVLTNILLEGECATTDMRTAEGVELALAKENGEKISDTIVMMSGYWQLPANPGSWKIELGGPRSKMIYTLEDSPVYISSFAQPHSLVTVRHKPGTEGMKVYNVSYSDFSNSTRVDVFSVASGHLYERLMKIMMLSVKRNSKYSVKFWIVKNFLSPTFKATLPIMAKQYNFSYQLVSYKWPTWLRPQYEKQRIIWGNKILFLDVIFPIDLDRVIYIDSDQIVRTDLNELMRMDFGDAPYAFTPMCNSRKETESFRFWKWGYWLEHLRGKPYHISALFAIDLRRFRQMAAGDWLRHHYQQLSADPGSLANLDQDLPNYAQDHIPIYSLPQEWLWCETWCSDDTMHTAKTIDLCNNPLTKRPKLEIAQQRVTEWPGLDEEARSISAAPEDYEKLFFK